MKIELQHTENLSIAALQGEVDLSNSPQARTVILDCLNSGRSLLVNLSAVDYIDSSGIATLVEGLRLAHDNKLNFGLLAVSDAVLRVLRLARLDQVFPLYADVNAYQASR